jgi:hypothetical protein
VETQATPEVWKQYAPRPRSGLQRVIYNVLHDAGKPLPKNKFWAIMPEECHKPHGYIKFSKALTNMTYRGLVVNVGSGRNGIYRLAWAEEFADKTRAIKATARKSARKAKKKAKKNAPKSGFTNEVVGRIDTRIEEMESRLRDLKALRGLVVEAKL